MSELGKKISVVRGKPTKAGYFLIGLLSVLTIASVIQIMNSQDRTSYTTLIVFMIALGLYIALVSVKLQVYEHGFTYRFLFFKSFGLYHQIDKFQQNKKNEVMVIVNQSKFILMHLNYLHLTLEELQALLKEEK